VVCCDFECRKVTKLQGRKEIRKIGGDLHLSLGTEVQKSGSM
jgi:hypothetical protein